MLPLILFLVEAISTIINNLGHLLVLEWRYLLHQKNLPFSFLLTVFEISDFALVKYRLLINTSIKNLFQSALGKHGKGEKIFNCLAASWRNFLCYIHSNDDTDSSSESDHDSEKVYPKDKAKKILPEKRKVRKLEAAKGAHSGVQTGAKSKLSSSSVPPPTLFHPRPSEGKARKSLPVKRKEKLEAAKDVHSPAQTDPKSKQLTSSGSIVPRTEVRPGLHTQSCSKETFEERTTASHSSKDLGIDKTHSESSLQRGRDLHRPGSEVISCPRYTTSTSYVTGFPEETLTKSSYLDSAVSDYSETSRESECLAGVRPRTKEALYKSCKRELRAIIDLYRYEKKHGDDYKYLKNLFQSSKWEFETMKQERERKNESSSEVDYEDISEIDNESGREDSAVSDYSETSRESECLAGALPRTKEALYKSCKRELRAIIDVYRYEKKHGDYKNAKKLFQTAKWCFERIKQERKRKNESSSEVDYEDISDIDDESGREAGGGQKSTAKVSKEDNEHARTQTGEQRSNVTPPTLIHPRLREGKTRKSLPVKRKEMMVSAKHLQSPAQTDPECRPLSKRSTIPRAEIRPGLSDLCRPSSSKETSDERIAASHSSKDQDMDTQPSTSSHRRTMDIHRPRSKETSERITASHSSKEVDTKPRSLNQRRLDLYSRQSLIRDLRREESLTTASDIEIIGSEALEQVRSLTASARDAERCWRDVTNQFEALPRQAIEHWEKSKFPPRQTLQNQEYDLAKSHYILARATVRYIKVLLQFQEREREEEKYLSRDMERESRPCFEKSKTVQKEGRDSERAEKETRNSSVDRADYEEAKQNCKRAKEKYESVKILCGRKDESSSDVEGAYISGVDDENSPHSD